MVRLQEKPGSQAADAIKLAALRLFAERGIDGVTVREIAAVAGQKNHGAVGYHFGSKAELIRQLVIDGASQIDRRRNDALDRFEAASDTISTADLVRLLVYPSIGLERMGEEECFNRFIVLLSMTHRDWFMEVLDGRWNSGFQRCLSHLRKKMDRLGRAAQTERIIFIESALGSVLAARETRLADASRPHTTWSRAQTLEHFVQAIVAVVEAPPPD